MLPDLNVLSAWSQGYTGSGVVLSILDDGLEKDHPDLKANYVSRIGAPWEQMLKTCQR